VESFTRTKKLSRRPTAWLAQGPWDYLAGGTESETSLRRNRLALNCGSGSCPLAVVETRAESAPRFCAPIVPASARSSCMSTGI
jgi:hypothetical protein